MLCHDDDEEHYARGLVMSMDSFENTAICLDSSQRAPTPQVRGLCECRARARFRQASECVYAGTAWSFGASFVICGDLSLSCPSRDIIVAATGCTGPSNGR